MGRRTLSPEEAPASLIECACCHAEAPIDGTTSKEWARIQRGALSPDSPENENIKFEVYLCGSCFFCDKDLCRFFNRIGWRIR